MEYFTSKEEKEFEDEEDRFYKTATLWQRICRYEPNHIKRVKKYIHARLEQYCARYVGRWHRAQRNGLALPARQERIFRIASWIECRIRHWHK